MFRKRSEPQALARLEPSPNSPDGLVDEMADQLLRLNGVGSGATRYRASGNSIVSVSSVDDRSLPRKQSRQELPQSPTSSISPTENYFRLPSYAFDPALLSAPSTPGESTTFERRPSQSSGANLSICPPSYPPPSRPPAGKLPSIPTPGSVRNALRRLSSSQLSADASDGASVASHQLSHTSSLERSPTVCTSPGSPRTFNAIPYPPPPYPPSSAGDEQQRSRPLYHAQPPPEQGHQQIQNQISNGSVAIDLVPWKNLVSGPDKNVKDPSVYYFDISTTSATLASKHGNNIIKIWSTGCGEVQGTLKVSTYTTAQGRSREYFVRSHAILSEPSNMIAIATGFGDNLEIWDWAKKKKLQSIDEADRWAAVRSNVMESSCCPLVTYRGEKDAIDLYAMSNGRKPFKKARTIDLRAAGLPVVPKYPELAFSATGPLLVAASGPRPPRLGHPPPKNETLLAAWDVHDDATLATTPHAPYKVVAPWQHTELETALPSGLATYGSIAVSIWIPASYRAVPIPASRGGSGYNLAPVSVPHRYVLVWDFAASSTKTFRIPNVISTVSPDCRFVAYCDARGVESGARGRLALLDATTGKQLWCYPDPDAGAFATHLGQGFEQLNNLSLVTEIYFSADGVFLFVGDSSGGIGVYEVRENGRNRQGRRNLSVSTGSAGGMAKSDGRMSVTVSEAGSLRREHSTHTY